MCIRGKNTLSQTEILKVLSKVDSMTIHEISDKLQISSNAISKNLSKMRKFNVVKHEPMQGCPGRTQYKYMLL